MMKTMRTLAGISAMKNACHPEAIRQGSPKNLNDLLKELVEQTIRAETPAHLLPNAVWMNSGDWAAFQTAYQSWLDKRRAHIAQKLGVDLDELGA